MSTLDEKLLHCIREDNFDGLKMLVAEHAFKRSVQRAFSNIPLKEITTKIDSISSSIDSVSGKIAEELVEQKLGFSMSEMASALQTELKETYSTKIEQKLHEPFYKSYDSLTKLFIDIMELGKFSYYHKILEKPGLSGTILMEAAEYIIGKGLDVNSRYSVNEYVKNKRKLMEIEIGKFSDYHNEPTGKFIQTSMTPLFSVLEYNRTNFSLFPLVSIISPEEIATLRKDTTSITVKLLQNLINHGADTSQEASFINTDGNFESSNPWHYTLVRLEGHNQEIFKILLKAPLPKDFVSYFGMDLNKVIELLDSIEPETVLSRIKEIKEQIVKNHVGEQYIKALDQIENEMMDHCYVKVEHDKLQVEAADAITIHDYVEASIAGDVGSGTEEGI